MNRVRSAVRRRRVERAARRYRPNGRATVGDLIESRVAADPECAFLIGGPDRPGGRLSYLEWNTRANRSAHLAYRRGLRRADVVAVLMEPRAELLSLWAGLAKLGIVTALLPSGEPTLWDGRAGKSALEATLASLGARWLVVGAELLGRLRLRSAIGFPVPVFVAAENGEAESMADFPEGATDLVRELAGMPTANPEPAWRRDVRTGDPLFYLYTSGSACDPVAARYSQLRFLADGAALASAAGYGPDDAIYNALPLDQGLGGVGALASALQAGASLRLARRYQPETFFDEIRDCGATAFHYQGELCRDLLDTPPSDADRSHGVRVAVGSGLRADGWEGMSSRFGIPRLIEYYAAIDGNVRLINLDGRSGAVGRIPLLSRSQRLVRYSGEAGAPERDARGRCLECRPGDVGELVVRVSPGGRAPSGRFEGYVSEDGVAPRLLSDAFRPGDRWLRSGDLLRRDARGYLYVASHTGDAFRNDGEEVLGLELSDLLVRYTGVRAAALYPVDVAADFGERRVPMAALELRDPRTFDGVSFYAFCRSELPGHARPCFVRLCTSIARAPTLRIRTARLRAEGYDPEVGGDPVWVRDDEVGAYEPLTPIASALIGKGRHPF